MAFRDLMPRSRNQEMSSQRDAFDPFLTLHREMNRLFDNVFHEFGSGSLSPLIESGVAWPKIEVNETNKALAVSAELPGLTEKDIQLEIANGVLTIRGEKKAERTDEGKGRYFSERYYGSFERRIPLEDVQEDKAEASFKNGVLTVTLPKSEQARDSVKRISINTQS